MIRWLLPRDTRTDANRRAAFAIADAVRFAKDPPAHAAALRRFNAAAAQLRAMNQWRDHAFLQQLLQDELGATVDADPQPEATTRHAVRPGK